MGSPHFHARLTPLFTDEELERLALSIWQGVYGRRNLPQDYFLRVLAYLTSGIDEGQVAYQQSSGIYRPHPELRFALQDNLQYFSAHKTYQQVRDLSRLVLQPDGAMRPRAKFLDLAMPVVRDYNTNWLAAEHQAVVGQTQSALQWQQFEDEADVLPLLKYQTVGDGNVRPEHRKLDGIVRPVSDSFWNRYMPLNGWGCRCDVVAVEGQAVSDLASFTDLTAKEQPPMFRHNPGKTKAVFVEHPYYTVPKQDQAFAKAGFGLYTPKADGR